METQTRLAAGTNAVSADVFLAALSTALMELGLSLQWAPGTVRVSMGWLHHPDIGTWIRPPEASISASLVENVAAAIGAPVRVYNVTCDADEGSFSLSYEASELSASGERVPVSTPMENEDLEVLTVGSGDDRLEQIIELLIGHDDDGRLTIHDFSFFMKTDDVPATTLAPPDDLERLEAYIDLLESTTGVSSTQVAEAAWQITLYNPRVKLFDGPEVVVERKADYFSQADAETIQLEMEIEFAHKIREPSVRPHPDDVALASEDDEDDFDDDFDDGFDEEGDEHDDDGGGGLSALLKNLLGGGGLGGGDDDTEGSSLPPVHPDAIVSSPSEARQLLELLLKQEALELETPTMPDDFVYGVFEIASQGKSAETTADQLADWILDQECVVELYIDNEKLANLLEVW